MDGDRVTGIRSHAPGGATVMEAARIVIGADGMRSLVARTVQPPAYHTKPALTCIYYTYWSGIPMEDVELYPRERRAIMAFPTNDDLVCIVVLWPNQEFHTVRTNIEWHYLKAIDLVPGLAKRVHDGRQEERFVGTADLPNFYHKPYGPGWALVGDAGYHKDPFTAYGIMDAFRDAELVAEAIDIGFSGGRPLEEALADYERQRNDVSLPMYELTCQLASLEPPPPQMQRLFAALHGNQAETNHFFGALEGMEPIPEFFSPENIGRIMAEGSPVASPSEHVH